MHKKLSRKQQKRADRNMQPHDRSPKSIGLHLGYINPRNKTQEAVFEAYYSGKNLMLHGCPGTGKTLCAIFLSLQEILETSRYSKLLIVRSAEPSKNIGFLPGSIKEKTKIYELPYQSICRDIFGRSDAYDVLKSHGKIEFITTSYVRGLTFDDCIVVVDEIQNLGPSECDTIITRMGSNCKILFSGDMRQTDLVKGKEKSGLGDFLKIIRRLNSFETIEFGVDDICRSKTVTEYIKTRLKMEDDNLVQPLGV